VNLFSAIGDFSYFFFRSVFIPWRLRETRYRILRQVYEVGINSLPIILIIAAFVGLVSIVQTSYQVAGSMPRYIIGATVGRMVMIELGPILTALMVSGRCASSMAAEIGTMRVTEQIDALEIMAIDPYRFLNLQRIMGTLIALPVLTVIAELDALLLSGAYAHFSTSGCYFGFKVRGGAREVGRAATLSVVTASILVLVLDFLVALVIFG